MATVLLVEDDEQIRELVKLRLELADHEVSVAENGEIGVEKALRDKPDIVIMDMHMPVMDGHEAAGAMREQNYTGLVVALTASALVPDTERAIESGCDAVITKPISEDFEDQVAKHIENFALNN